MKINSLRNVFGIKDMTSGVEQLGNSCIYASNGVFKTSFAKFMFYLSREDFDSIKEVVSNKTPKFDIEINGVQINESIKKSNITDLQKKELSNIVVFSNSIYRNRTLNDTSTEITKNRFKKVTVDEQLQIELEKNKVILEKVKDEINDALTVGLTKNQGNQLKNHYFDVMNISKLDINTLSEIVESALSTGPLNISFIPWKEISSTAYKKVVNDEEFIKKTSLYLEIINRKIISDVFDDVFNDTTLDLFLNTIKTTGFMSENRVISINGTMFNNYEDLDSFLKSQVEQIKMSPEVKTVFQEVEKSLDSSAASRSIREFLKDTEKIKTLSKGTKGIISSRIYENISSDRLAEIKNELGLLKKEFEKIGAKAKLVRSNYEKAIEIFNNRFQPPFTSEIDNREDSLIGLDLPVVKFIHKDNKKKKLGETEISEILSSGELSALKIIHLIVECESLINDKPLIIIDDIVETFDYANRVATVEYLQDLSKIGARVILLTHNFDFFRFSQSRIRIIDEKKNTKQYKKIYAYKGLNNKVVLNENVLKDFDLKRMREINNAKEFLAIIPMAREIADIRNEDSLDDIKHHSDDFLILTYALHYDKAGISVTVKDIIDVIERHIPIKCEFSDADLSKKYYDYILENDFNISEDVDLEGKLSCSVKIRILMDMYMMKYSKGNPESVDFTVPGSGKSNQTRVLYETNKELFNEEGLKIIEKALLITPEYIHFNAFMYEPLIDITKKELTELYIKINQLEYLYK